MFRRVHLLSLGLAASCAGALGACTGAPQNPGDSCDLQAQNCPAPLVCSKDADRGDICQIPPGGTCDPGVTPDLCLDAAVCETSGSTSTCILYVAEGGTCDPTNDYVICNDGLSCVEMAAGGHACFPPVLLRGMVFDGTTTAAIEGAHVLALDEIGAAVTDVALSDAAGNYELEVSVPRAADGSPTPDTFVTLRASAQDYATFPGGIRTALPIESSLAVKDTDAWVIDAAITDIALLPLPANEQGQPSISGSVLAGDLSGGVLVVAEDGTSRGRTAVTDKSGAYTIFNVPAGSYTVSGYAADLSLDTASAMVAGADVVGVDLATNGDALSSVSGSVQIVNAPGGSLTSVVLVVESTFDDTFVRGEVPQGLRAPRSGPPDVSGAFTIDGVPPGSYVVLAAFENDGLVRDPDPNISGTQIVTIDVPSPGMPITLSSSFKITEALSVVSPGANDPEPISAGTPPMLTWADDSSEDYYEVVVYDAFGNLVWQQQVPKVTSGDVSVAYGGPPLQVGMFYQFRATSWRQSGMQPAGPISTTEDLKGVFWVE